MRNRWLALWVLVSFLAQAAWPAARAAAQEAPEAVAARYALPGEIVLTVPVVLRYGGQDYSLHLYTRNTALKATSQLLANLDTWLTSPNNDNIQGMLVTTNGQVVTNMDTLEEVLTYFRVGYVLYEERTLPVQLRWVDDTFANELNNSLLRIMLLPQAVGNALFKSETDYLTEALRAMLVPQSTMPGQLESFGQFVRETAETSDELIGLAEAAAEVDRFSNLKRDRLIAKQVEKWLKSWSRINEDGAPKIKAFGQKMPLVTALDLIPLAVKLAWLTEYHPERVRWLEAYNNYFLTDDSRLTIEQQTAVNTVLVEVNSDTAKISSILLSFTKDKANDLAVGLPVTALTEAWVKDSWKTFGKRTTGHFMAGWVARINVAFTIADILYGLDDLYNNFRVAASADTLRRRFHAGRLLIEAQADEQAEANVYDVRRIRHYQSAYLLEAMATAQLLRSYADGVESTVKDDLTQYFNPVSWVKGNEWRAAAIDFRQKATDGEAAAQQAILAPVWLPDALKQIQQRYRLSQLTMDNAEAGFKESGPTDFWLTSTSGFRNGSLWTKNELSQTKNTGQWTLKIYQTGIYRAQAYIPPASPEISLPYTTAARYRITGSATDGEVVKNQAEAAGAWLDLGLYYVEAGQAVAIELLDQTGEPTGSTAIVFDAVQWVPVPESAAPNLYDARQVGAAYDIVVAGETAVLTFTVQNTGLKPWNDGEFVLVGDISNTKDATSAFSVEGPLKPGATATYTVSLPITGTFSILTLNYQMQRDGQPFGPKLSGQVFVLPPELRQVEEGIRNQIEEWQKQGEQAVEDLMKQIQDAIQREVEKQVQRQLEELCGGAASALLFAGVIGWQGVRRQRSRREE